MLIPKSERIARVVITIFLILLAIICVLPMVYELAVSFSTESFVTTGQVTFWPVGFTTASYAYLMNYSSFWKSMLTSFERVILQWLLCMVLTVLTAYPLSRTNKQLFGRTVLAWIFFIPMIFNGGLIPSYMVVSTLGLLGSIWALVLPSVVVTFYVLLLMNFIRRDGRGRHDRRRKPHADSDPDHPAGHGALLGDDHGVYHAGHLERVVPRRHLHERSVPVSPDELSALHGADLQHGESDPAGAGTTGEHRQQDLSGGAAVHCQRAHAAGVSLPAKVFHQGSCAGLREGLTKKQENAVQRRIFQIFPVLTNAILSSLRRLGGSAREGLRQRSLLPCIFIKLIFLKEVPLYFN